MTNNFRDSRHVISMTFLISLLLSLVLSACGGGGGGSSGADSAVVSLSGVAQKGLFTELVITAYPVNEQTGVVDRNSPIAATTDASSYQLPLPDKGTYLLEATGTFINEITGEPVLLKTPLKSLVTVTADSTASNINLLTQLYSDQVLARIDDGFSLLEAMAAAQEIVEKSLGFKPGTDFTTLDMTDIKADATLDDPNLQLLLLSGSILLQLPETSTLTSFGELIGNFPGISDVATAQDYFSVLEGNAALAIYTGAQDTLNLPDLPVLNAGIPVFTCEPLQPCAWEIQTVITASVIGSSTLEADGLSSARVQLSASPASAVRVVVESVAGSADAGADYVPFREELLFNLGKTTQKIKIPLILDNSDEGSEAFTVQIVSIDDGYGITNSSAQMTLVEGLGGSDAGLGAGQVDFESFCISGIGDGHNLTAGDCLGLPLSAIPDNDTAAMTLDLAMSVACEGTGCEPWTRDWAVEFVLEALTTETDLRGNVIFNIEDSVIFARHRFDGGKLIRADEPIQSYSVYAQLGKLFRQLSSRADTNGWFQRIKARLVGVDEISALAGLRAPLLLPETIQAGGLTLPFHVQSIQAGSTANTCAINTYQLTAEYSLDGSVFQDSTICVERDSASGALTLTDGRISIAGNTLELLPFHSTFHSSYLRGDTLARPDVRALPVFTVPLPTAEKQLYIHAEGLPFAFAVSDTYIDSNGINIDYGHLKYLKLGEFDQTDPRFSDPNYQISSNDIMFQSTHAGTLQLTAGGIQATLPMAAGHGRYAFPLGDIEWGGFELEIKDGQIYGAPFNVPALHFSLEQNIRCANVYCGESPPEIHHVTGEVKMDGAGAIVAANMIVQPTETSVPRWGAHADSAESAFTRLDDLMQGSSAALSLPGFAFSNFPDPRLDKSLYAHQYYSTGGGVVPVVSIVKFRLDSADAVEGNLWPTGISVGPQFYARSTNGWLPETGEGRNLDRSRLVLNNGVDDPYALNVSAGAKYVIRNAGITGVFNIAADSLIDPITVYGYRLNFDRFAFRLVDNAMDEFSWIDGKLRIPHIDDSPAPVQNADGTAGAGGFDLKFASLTLDCDGGFAGASPIPDPASPQSLNAWNAGTDIHDMDFDDRIPNNCEASAKVLKLDQTLVMKALDKPLSLLDVEWNADGSVGKSSVLGQQEYIFDANNDLGFTISTRNGRLQSLQGADLYGVVKLDNTLIVTHAWQSPGVDIRLRNDSLGAAPSIVTTTGVIDAGDVLTNDAFNLVDNRQYDLNMRYNWGHSRFGFMLPVYYSPGDSFTQSQFTGRYQESDLLVMQAGAGIDYIKPDISKLSFGLSADIAKIQRLPLSLDLADAASIERMDSFLAQSGLGAPGLTALLGTIQQKLQVISSLGGRGLDQALRDRLASLLDELVGQQMVTISRTLTLAQSVPNQLFAVLDEDVNTTASANLTVNARTLLLKLEFFRDELLGINSSTADLTLLEQQREQILQTLRLMRSDADARVEEQLDRLNQLSTLFDQLATQLPLLNDALLQLTSSSGVKLAFSTSGEFCVDGSLNYDPENGHLTPVVELGGSVTSLLNEFEYINLAASMQGLSASAGPELQNLLEDTEQLIHGQSEMLLVEWNNGFPVWKISLCAEASTGYTQKLDEYLVGLQQDGGSLLEKSVLLASKIDDLNSQFATITQNANSGYEVFSDYLDTVIELFSLPVQVNLETASGNGEQAWLNMNESFASSSAVLSGDLQFLLADAGSGGADLFNTVINPTLDEYAFYPELLRQTVDNIASFEFPSANFDPLVFRTILVDKVMDTPAMNDLQSQVQQFTGPLLDEISTLNLNLNDHINAIIKKALAATNPQVNDLLNQASSAISAIPLKSAGIDGYARFLEKDLDLIHLDASWQMDKAVGGIAGPSFNAALDIKANWGGDGGAVPCEAPPGVDSFEVSISATNVQANLFGDATELERVKLDFILAEGDVLAYQPVSIGGGLSITKPVEYAGFTLQRFNFEASLGKQEVYIGAGGGGLFSDLAMDLSAFFGRTCDATEVIRIDSKSKDLLPFTAGEPFAGLYLRGEVTAPLPILNAGCALQISFRGSAGSWITLEPVAQVGGIMGGAALGSVACVGSVRGQVDTVGAININGSPYFAGQAFVIAGAGADCDRYTWTDVGRSRKDRWCGTGDFKTGVSFGDGKWSYDPGTPSVLH